MNIQKESGFIHVALVCVFVFLVGFVGFVGVRALLAHNKSQMSSSEDLAMKTALPATLEGIRPFDDIKDLATKNTDSTIKSFELNNENGTLTYKIRLSNDKVVTIDAKTGKVLMSMKMPDDSSDDEQEGVLPKSLAVSISFNKAREVAQAKFPQGKITKIHLDMEGGVLVLSVRFADKARVDVNAKTGEVVRTKNPEQKAAENEKMQSTGDSATMTSDDSMKSGTTSSTGGSPTIASGSNSGSTSGSGSGSSGSGSSGSSDDGNDEFRVEGTLMLFTGGYTISVNDTLYTVKASWDISGLVGKSVRVEGALGEHNVITASKVELR